MKYINTVEELEKYIGKIVLFYYTDTHKKDGKVKAAWAKKITKIRKQPQPERRYSRTPIDGTYVYGINTVFFVSSLTHHETPYPHLSSKYEKFSNAQEFARELTATELIMYRMAVMRNKYK
jgi:hypothetical protein